MRRAIAAATVAAVLGLGVAATYHLIDADGQDESFGVPTPADVNREGEDFTLVGSVVMLPVLSANADDPWLTAVRDRNARRTTTRP